MGHLVHVVWSILVGGFTLMTLWSWFMVPLGLPAIGFAHAVGIEALVSWLVPTHTISWFAKSAAKEHDIDPDNPWVRMSIFTFLAGFCLAMGFFAQMAM